MTVQELTLELEGLMSSYDEQETKNYYNTYGKPHEIYSKFSLLHKKVADDVNDFYKQNDCKIPDKISNAVTRNTKIFNNCGHDWDKRIKAGIRVKELLETANSSPSN